MRLKDEKEKIGDRLLHRVLLAPGSARSAALRMDSPHVQGAGASPSRPRLMPLHAPSTMLWGQGCEVQLASPVPNISKMHLPAHATAELAHLDPIQRNRGPFPILTARESCVHVHMLR